MAPIREQARAKLNLTLRVLGRRGDGYHEIDSLVAFAGAHDTVELEPGGGLSLAVEGPFSPALETDNLILHAARGAKAASPEIELGHFRLVKNLPVAAGLGGGSADAAAALRLISRANPGLLTGMAMEAMAAGLGSDVTVCLRSAPALIRGRGEVVRPVAGFPSCGVVLANPRLPLATASVYAALDTKPLGSLAEQPAPPDFGGSFEKLIDYLRPHGNDLEAPALRLVSAIRDVLDALRAPPNARIARMSGSGPTCFAFFADEAEARDAATPLAAQHPDWWITATSL